MDKLSTKLIRALTISFTPFKNKPNTLTPKSPQNPLFLKQIILLASLQLYGV